MKVGLIGAFLNNSNMGCVALACSIIRLLQEIEEEEKIKLDVTLFEASPGKEKLELYSRELDVDLQNFSFSETAWVYNLRALAHWKRHEEMKANLKKCDFIIDMTGGDSFSDIYGKKRFYFWSNIKKYIIKKKIPLILGPQTYGPYENKRVKKFAKYIIEKSSVVIARDEKSLKYIKEIANVQAKLTTDVAFQLPCQKGTEIFLNNEKKKKIGINVSGLLYLENSDSSLSEKSFKTDYKEYIHDLISELLKKDDCEIYLIGHVKCDMEAVEKVQKLYPKCHTIPWQETPMEIKYYISKMDVFIGSRMHATVAAFSSQIAMIPVAYSRKFAGLYENVGYDVLIDLQGMTLNEALLQTFEYIEHSCELQQKVLACQEIVQEKAMKNKELIKEFIKRRVKG